MSNTVYYCGYRLEQFNGPGNSGSPIYTSVTATDSSEYKNLGYITLDETTQNPNNWGHGALFGGFVDSKGASTKLDNFWVTAELGLRYSTLATTYYSVTGITLNQSGFGYKVGDTITIPNAGTVTVASISPSGVNSSGTILSGEISNEAPWGTTDPTGTNIPSTLIAGSGATFNVTSTSSTTYTPASITLNAGGTGYAVKDTITIPNTGTVTVTAVDSSGVITAVTSVLDTTPESKDMAGTAVTGTTSGSGSGATFNVTSTSSTTYTPASITLNAAGKGYVVGDVITITNAGTVTVTTVDHDGAILTITTVLDTTPQTTDMAGTGISGTLTVGSGATFNVVGKKTSGQYVNTSLTLNTGGSGYSIGEVLTLGRVIGSEGSYQTVTVGTITVTSIGYGTIPGTIPGPNGQQTTYTAITGFTSYLDTTPTTSDLAGVVVMTSASGGGSGATFTLSTTHKTFYSIDTISIANGGSGYKEGNVLTIGDSLATFTVKGSSIETITTSIITTPTAIDPAAVDISGTTSGNGIGATFNVTSNSSLEYALIEYSPMVIHSTTNNVYVQLKASTTNINEYRVILCTSLTDITTYKDTGIIIPITDTGTDSPPITRFSIQFTGFGTTSGSIEAFISGKKVGSWTGDLSSYSDFDQISFHKGSPESPTNFYYCYVTDYATRYSYLEYQTATKLGTTAEWSGDLTTFSTYPVDYYTIGGLYATDANQVVTFGYDKQFDVLTGYVPSAVVFSSALITDDDSTEAEVAGVVKGTSTSSVSYTQAPNADGSCITWYYGEDPVANTDWTIANVNGYEFGLERTK